MRRSGPRWLVAALHLVGNAWEGGEPGGNPLELFLNNEQELPPEMPWFLDVQVFVD